MLRLLEELDIRTAQHLELMKESRIGFVVGLSLQLMVRFPDIPEFAPITDPEEREAALARWAEVCDSRSFPDRESGKQYCIALQNYIRAMLGGANVDDVLVPK